MNYSAVRATPLPDTVIPVERGGIRRKLAQVRMQLACAEDLFNSATDEAVLDSSIYQLKSLQVYYSFLMRQLRLEELGIQIVGDDLFTTNLERVRYGISKGAANTVLFKVNQAGTIRERACYPVGNRFLEIERELGPRARFRGVDGFKGSLFARK